MKAMSCKDYAALLDDLVDGTLGGEARRRVEAHLETCAGCRGTTADLRRIREAARSLPRVDPPADGWSRLSAGLDRAGRPGLVAAPSPAREARGASGFATWRPAWGFLAAAAVLAIAVATTLLLYRTTPAGDRAPAAGQAANAASADLVSSVETELQLADQHYQKAIAGLEQVWKEGQGTVDPQTAAVLQKNMGIIDQAVRESREALRAQPTSEAAQETLFEALRRKVDLLKDMVALVNEMRKGNQAGAAQIVSGIER
ncbi:MAG: putative transrane transcriptional regulator (anti-sigma factor) [Acidobacteria bacterium]|nr:putative transrane transcriptional regulator (anti-sigma factor) [Acidobacteriota bacterium]